MQTFSALENTTMELNSELLTIAPRPAATVVLLREISSRMEVLLLKRHSNSDVLGGVYVFPGGKVDGADLAPKMNPYLDQTPSALHAKMNEPDIDAQTATGLYVAAIREAFEESGILLVDRTAPGNISRALQFLRSGMQFHTILDQLSLRLHTQEIHPWCRWITPKLASVTKKRFDTRFFIAALPANQIVEHDNHEATESVWLTPRAALEQYWSGSIELAPPQIMSLSHLSHHASVESVMKEAISRPPPLIEPEPFDYNGTRVLCYPGDDNHSIRQRAMPGPTRLYFRNKRFEPENGFEALIG